MRDLNGKHVPTVERGNLTRGEAMEKILRRESKLCGIYATREEKRKRVSPRAFAHSRDRECRGTR